MIRQNDTILGKYKILHKIGQGGMSKVWLAQDKNLNKLWAVKEISKKTAEYQATVNEKQTITEIELMKKLSHPALPRIVEVIDDKNSLCIVMDYIEGETLSNLLDMYGKQSEELVVPWMLEVCDILSYLHNQDPPIIYRDMKPSNIMINPDGHVKIIDFGIAREYKGDVGDTMPLGTRGFASPEHFTKHTDARSDIFCVGATMYMCLTGLDPSMPPYKMVPIREVDPSLSTGLEKIILKATRQNPDERYQTAEELASALESHESLDDDYLEELEQKINKSKFRLQMSVLLIIAGLVLAGIGTLLDRRNYNSLVNNIPESQEMAIAALEKAIDINPTAEDAYLKLINVFAEDQKFTEKESAEFLRIYNKYSTKFNAGENAKTGNYQIGEAYLKYYTGETDESKRSKLLAAEPFFKAAKGESFALDYVYLAEYYRNYVFVDNSLLATDSTKADYEDLLKECSDIVRKQASGNTKIRSLTYTTILQIIESERVQMLAKKIPKSDILSIVNNIKQLGDESNRKSAERLIDRLKAG